MPAPFRFQPCAVCCSCTLWDRTFNSDWTPPPDNLLWDILSGTWTHSGATLYASGAACRTRFVPTVRATEYRIRLPQIGLVAGQTYSIWFGADDAAPHNGHRVDLTVGPAFGPGAYRLFDPDGNQIGDTYDSRVVAGGSSDDFEICIWSEDDGESIVVACPEYHAVEDASIGWDPHPYRIATVPKADLLGNTVLIGGDSDGGNLEFSGFLLQRAEGTCPDCDHWCAYCYEDEQACLHLTVSGFADGDNANCDCNNGDYYLRPNDRRCWSLSPNGSTNPFTATGFPGLGRNPAQWGAGFGLDGGTLYLIVFLQSGHDGSKIAEWRAAVGTAETRIDCTAIDETLTLHDDGGYTGCDLSGVTIQVTSRDLDDCPRSSDYCGLCANCGETSSLQVTLGAGCTCWDGPGTYILHWQPGDLYSQCVWSDGTWELTLHWRFGVGVNTSICGVSRELSPNAQIDCTNINYSDNNASCPVAIQSI